VVNYVSLLKLHRPHEKYNLCNLPLNKKYRSHFEIIALVIEAVKDDFASRFSIMMHANLNCSQLKKYLQPLIEIGFIETNVRNGRVIYKASEKGLDFLGKYYALLRTLLSVSEEYNSAKIIYKIR
jgi:predicted transcriptional regulator